MAQSPTIGLSHDHRHSATNWVNENLPGLKDAESIQKIMALHSQFQSSHADLQVLKDSVVELATAATLSVAIAIPVSDGGKAIVNRLRAAATTPVIQAVVDEHVAALAAKAKEQV